MWDTIQDLLNFIIILLFLLYCYYYNYYCIARQLNIIHDGYK